MSTPHPPGVPCDGWPPMSQASSTPDPAPWAPVPACSLPPAPGAPSSPAPSTSGASQPQAGPTASGPSSSSAGGSNSSSRQRGTVLVVDDMAINRVVLGHMVRKAGLDVVEATNGQEAIEQVATHPPGHFQCILMDLQMPVVDGWQATQQIRAWEAGYARANSAATLPGPVVGSPFGAPYRMQTYMTDDMGGGVMSHALLSRSTTYMTDELAGGDGRLGTCAAPSRSSTCVRDEAGCQAGRGFGRSGTCMTDELQPWGSMGTPGQLPSSGALAQGSEDLLGARSRSGPSAGASSGSSMHALLPQPGGLLPAAAQVAMPIAAAVRATAAHSSHFNLEQLAAAAADAAVAGEPAAAGSYAAPGSQDLARHQHGSAAAAQQLPLGVGVTQFVQQRQQQREQQPVWYGVSHPVLPTQQLLLPLGALRLSANCDAGAAVPASAAAVAPATGPAVSLDLGPWRQQVLQAPPGVQRSTRPAPGLGPLSEGSNSGSGSSSSTSSQSRHAPLLPGTTPAHHVLAAGRSSRSGLQPGELAEELGFLDDACLDEPFLLRGCNACNLSREPLGPPAADHDHDIDDDGTLSDSFSDHSGASHSGASTPRGMGFPGMHDAGLAATLSLLGSGLLEPDNAAYARAASRLPVQEVESEDDDAAPGAALGAAVDGGASQPQSGQLPLVHDGDDVAAVAHEEGVGEDDQVQAAGAQVAGGPAGPTAAGSSAQHGQPAPSNPFRTSSPLLLQPPTPRSEAGPAPAAAPPTQLARERLLALMVEAPGPLERPDGAFSFARMHSTPWSGFGALATPPSSALQLRLGTTCPLGVGPSYATSHHTTSSWGRSHSAVLSGGPPAVRVPIVACTAEVLGGPPVNCPSFVETTPPSSPPMTAAQHALSCGVDECVRKPLSFQELCGLLSKYIPAWAEDHADMAPAATSSASAGPSRSTTMRPADVRQRPPLLRRQHLQVLPEVQAAGEAEGPGQSAEAPGAQPQQQH